MKTLCRCGKSQYQIISSFDRYIFNLSVKNIKSIFVVIRVQMIRYDIKGQSFEYFFWTILLLGHIYLTGRN